MRLLCLVSLLVLSIGVAENYAVIYASVEQYTNIDLPSSACRLYNHLLSNNIKKENIVYMLDTTDYHQNYTETYTSWFSKENIYLRDSYFKHSCHSFDFEGTYVSPKFLLHYLIGDEKNVKKLSGKSTIRMISPSADDNLLVYFSDSHGRGSQFHPDRVLTPDLVKKSVLIMKKHKRFHSLVWLVEAAYADYSFHKLDKMKNVLALTLKDSKSSGYFTHIYQEEQKYHSVDSIWDVDWPSIVALSCGKNFQYLYQLTTSALLQMVNKLEMPGIWGDRKLLEKPVYDFVAKNMQECKRFYAFKEEEIPQEKIKDKLSTTFGKNYNTTLPFEQTRKLFKSYNTYLDSIIHEVFMGEIGEEEAIPITNEGCIDFLLFSLQKECDYYMPLIDVFLEAFHSLCNNRRNGGMIAIDFKSYCSKNKPESNL